MPATRTVALVTGANRGIGREIVRRLAADGVTTILAARDPAKAEAVAADFAKQGLPVVGRQLDVTDAASVDRLVKSVADEFGTLDILVNNAGVYLDADRNSTSKRSAGRSKLTCSAPGGSRRRSPRCSRRAATDGS